MSGGGFFYAYRTYTASVSGSTRRHVRCVGCLHEYDYVLHRSAYGGGHSAFFLANESASYKAKERARANLAKALDEGVDAVFCPSCGIYQPDMVSLLKRQLGPKCDPNKWASMRAKVPVQLAWREVQAADTLLMYSRFAEMWPTQHALVADRIWELEHPTLVILKRGLSLGFWLLWGAVALTIVALFVVLPLLAHYFNW
jgi:hypothetical protein